ncbi:hypothetical protein ABZ806_29400 [Spirillospora sp. NPDC047418]
MSVPALRAVLAAPEEAGDRGTRPAGGDLEVAGHHMNKRHWITLGPGDAIDKKLVKELVELYRLVVANLPKSRRPVDPAQFGTV